MGRLAWKHFALVTLVFVLFQAAMWSQDFYTWPHRPDPVPWSGILRYLWFNWPRDFVSSLPAIAGIAVALLDLRPGALRTAVTMGALVLGVMIVYDVWCDPALNRAAIAATYGPAEWPIRADSVTLRLDDTAGVLQRSVALLRGKVQPSDLQPWPPKMKSNSGLTVITDAATIVRIEATRTLAEFHGFLLPFIDLGLILGITSWITRRARFERPRDARVIRVVAAWLVVLFVEGFIFLWMQSHNYPITARGGSLLWLYVPIFPALLLAALGWRAAIRTSRLAGM